MVVQFVALMYVLPCMYGFSLGTSASPHSPDHNCWVNWHLCVVLGVCVHGYMSLCLSYVSFKMCQDQDRSPHASIQPNACGSLNSFKVNKSQN